MTTKKLSEGEVRKWLENKRDIYQREYMDAERAGEKEEIIEDILDLLDHLKND